MDIAVPQPESDDTTFMIPYPWLSRPWERRLNPFYESGKAASTAWFSSYTPFDPAAQQAFDRCNSGLLIALAYPHHSAEKFRVICDFIQIVFAFDEFTDVKNESSVREMASCAMSAVRGTHKPHGCKLGTMLTDFWERLIVIMPSTFYQRRFVDALQRFTASVVQEAQDRELGCIRDVAEYFELRRDTIGTYPCWVFIHMGLEIPETLFADPRVREIEGLAGDMVLINNDMLSYNVEQLRGLDHNLITTIVTKEGLTVQAAMDWAGEQCKKLMAQLDEAKEAIPSFGKHTDDELARYIEGLCGWIRAADAWSFEGERYFGDLGPSIQKHRRVVLRR